MGGIHHDCWWTTTTWTPGSRTYLEPDSPTISNIGSDGCSCGQDLWLHGSVARRTPNHSGPQTPPFPEGTTY